MNAEEKVLLAYLNRGRLADGAVADLRAGFEVVWPVARVIAHPAGGAATKIVVVRDVFSGASRGSEFSIGARSQAQPNRQILRPLKAFRLRERRGVSRPVACQ